jgi:uncharacterized protein YggE
MDNPATPTPSGQPHFGLSAAYFCLAVVAVLIFGVLAAGMASQKAMTVNVTNPGSGGITVTGSATVHATPDIATLNLGVSITAPTIKEARANVAAAAGRVIDALHAAGVVDADIATNNISLYQTNPANDGKTYTSCPVPATGGGSSTSSGGAIPPINPQPADSLPPVPDASPISVATSGPVSIPSAGVITVCPPCYGNYANCGSGWTYSENLTVTVRDLDRASDALDGAIAAGATNVGGISFDVSNRDTFLSSAQTQAVAAAKAQAAKLASAAGATLGAPLSITTSYYGGGVYAAPDAKSASGGSSTPISPGTLDITASVTVVFALNP